MPPVLRGGLFAYAGRRLQKDERHVGICSAPASYERNKVPTADGQNPEGNAVNVEHELMIELMLDAPREKVYRCWSEPELLKQWFAPKPWTTPSVVTDLRPGGASLITMRSPEGQEFPNPGQWLEVIPGRKLVFSDAFIGDWVPKDGVPFFTGVLTFEDAGPGKMRYTARARHWTAEAKAQHEQMGFVPGWTQCARQLEELAKTL